MLEATATPAMSAADSRPAMTASIVPLPTTARLARNSGHASRRIALRDVSGAGRVVALMTCDCNSPPPYPAWFKVRDCPRDIIHSVHCPPAYQGAGESMTGKVAIITGSGSGIGAASAVLLAKNGWNVVINYASRVDPAREVARACEAHGTETLLCKANV